MFRKVVLVAALTLAAQGPAAAEAAGCGQDAALVGEFVAAYRDAVLGLGGTGRTPSEVRALYLTPELNARLDAWAAAHRLDPVFRAADPPDAWRTGCAGGAVLVVEEWRRGGTLPVRYTVRAADRSITGIGGPQG
ncbi:hypothetical protein [Kitasatospora terrestris]|uniref:Uncharacterized protein n=1 Tax=Kitasatospora terrestris TaxID=258051 RepID=A0ABP9DQP5_9ACTN